MTGCGCGSSFVVEALDKTGIGKFTIVDMDIVNPSNINLQLVALHSIIGIAIDAIDILNVKVNLIKTAH
nr:ThiF family adenylyltransferase [Francisella persica]